MRRARQLAVAGGSLCGIAALFAIPALYVPGLAALIAAFVAPAWVRLAAARARVSLELLADTVSEGERVEMRIEVARRGPRTPGMALAPGPGCGEVALSGAASETVELSMLALRRGLHLAGPACVRVADPLGICVCEVVSQQRELLVLPRVERLDERASRQIEGRGASRRARKPAGDSLRPYRPGAPAARIHWPTVARTGTLIERAEIAEEEPGRSSLVVLDAEQPSSAEALEQAVRAAASLCFHLARRGGCDLLLPGAKRTLAIRSDLKSWPAALRGLALVQADARCLLGGLRGRSVELLWITASHAGAPPWQEPCLRVAPEPLAGRPVAFNIAGCSAQSIETGAWALSA